MNADPLWDALRAETAAAARAEPSLASLLHKLVLDQPNFSAALLALLAHKLSPTPANGGVEAGVIASALAADPSIADAAEADLEAVFERDAACRQFLQAFLFFKGFHALQGHRVAHALWVSDRVMMAYHVQSVVSERFAVDIHPAARIGCGVMIDHATGVVIGETAVVGDDCSLLHGVTLGGTGVAKQDRHPKIGHGVLIGAGAKVLGNISVGDQAKIAAGSVVLKPVPAQCTVAGVPAKPVGGPCAEPARNMDQTLDAGGE